MPRPLIFSLRPERPCPECWETFTPHSNNQIYCSVKCRDKKNRRTAVAIREAALAEGSGGSFLKLRFAVLRRDSFTCQYCGKTPQDGIKLHIDHIHPKTKGGELALDNLITSCEECNLGKGDVVLTKREKEKLKSALKRK